MAVPIHQVDAFTDVAFAGNPAAVCILDSPRDEAWMQNVAREMNLSETAFLVRRDDGFGLRWFTPAVEVELCGHATLASAHVLWEAGLLERDARARFHTLSGLLTADLTERGIEMDFPARPDEPADPPPDLTKALGVTPDYVGRTAYDFLVLVPSEEAVRGTSPDFALLRRIGVRGIMVTAPAATAGFDFVSRFFAPGAGVDEDPVTGSAHCSLGPFWRRRLGKDELVAYQASPRGGVVGVRVAGDRVHLTGRAVTVLRGELLASE
jgi:PhzF family phenazine biosynthesis protein